MGYYRMANMSEETEWYSMCCTAPPLYDLHQEEETDTIGICMKCREHASFEKGDDDEWNRISWR